MEKCDVKKGLKNILISFLNQQEQYREFCRQWITILVFFNIEQLVQQDFKGLREQFKQNLKMTALFHLYTSQYNNYIKKLGPCYSDRVRLNSWE